jgi:serine/threonine-protein kinase RIM15
MALEDVSPRLRDLVERLLEPDPNKRLGAQGAAEIKSHPFFEGLDWGRLRYLPAAFVPAATDAMDLSYFDPSRARGMEFPEEDDVPEAPQSPSSASASGGSTMGTPEVVGERPRAGSMDRKHFSNFSYISLPALQAKNREALIEEQEHRRSSPGT